MNPNQSPKPSPRRRRRKATCERVAEFNALLDAMWRGDDAEENSLKLTFADRYASAEPTLETR